LVGMGDAKGVTGMKVDEGEAPAASVIAAVGLMLLEGVLVASVLTAALPVTVMVLLYDTPVGRAVTEALGVHALVRVTVLVSDALWELEMVTLCEAVTLLVAEGVTDVLGDSDEEMEADAEAVGEYEGVSLEVEEGESVALGLEEGEIVSLELGEGDAVALGDEEGEMVSLELEEGEMVAVVLEVDDLVTLVEEEGVNVPLIV
jgi:hypothetical protein